MESSDWPKSCKYLFLSLLTLVQVAGFLWQSKLEAGDCETKELLYCGKGQRSWLFLGQADTVAVLKSTVKLDNKIVKQEQWNRELHATMSLEPTVAVERPCLVLVIE